MLRLKEALADRYTLERQLRIHVVLNWFNELRAKVPR